jgi:hypothetical protein
MEQRWPYRSQLNYFAFAARNNSSVSIMCQQQVVSVDQSKVDNEKSQTAELEYCLPEYFREFETKLDKHFKLAERGVNVRTEAIASIAFFVSCIYVLPVVPANLKLVSFLTVEE